MNVNDKTVYEITNTGIETFKEFKDNWNDPISYLYQNLINS